MQLKNSKCDDCGKEKEKENEGSNYQEFGEDYETIVRNFWLCNNCIKKHLFAW